MMWILNNVHPPELTNFRVKQVLKTCRDMIFGKKIRLKPIIVLGQKVVKVEDFSSFDGELPLLKPKIRQIE